MKNIHQIKNPELVNNVFDNVYQNYDLMNDIMSFGAHRMWKKEFIKAVDIVNTDQVIDMASGTGDIAKLILEKDKENMKINSKKLAFKYDWKTIASNFKNLYEKILEKK